MQKKSKKTMPQTSKANAHQAKHKLMHLRKKDLVNLSLIAGMSSGEEATKPTLVNQLVRNKGLVSLVLGLSLVGLVAFASKNREPEPDDYPPAVPLEGNEKTAQKLYKKTVQNVARAAKVAKLKKEIEALEKQQLGFESITLAEKKK